MSTSSVTGAPKKILTSRPPVSESQQTKKAVEKEVKAKAKVEALDKVASIDKDTLDKKVQGAIAQAPKADLPRKGSTVSLKEAVVITRQVVDKYGESDKVKKDPKAAQQHQLMEAAVEKVEQHLKVKEELNKSLTFNNTVGVHAPAATASSAVKEVDGRYVQGESELTKQTIKRVVDAVGEGSKSMRDIAAGLNEKYGTAEEPYCTYGKKQIEGSDKPVWVLEFKNGDKIVDTDRLGQLDRMDFNLGSAVNQMLAKNQLDLGELSEAGMDEVLADGVERKSKKPLTKDELEAIGSIRTMWEKMPIPKFWEIFQQSNGGGSSRGKRSPGHAEDYAKKWVEAQFGPKDAKPGAKVDAKPDAKPDATPEAKPAAEPDATPDAKVAENKADKAADGDKAA